MSDSCQRLLYRSLSGDDWGVVRTIYADGIATGYATFETDAGNWDRWDQRHLNYCRIVGEYEGKICSFAALTKQSARPVYSGVAEVSVYVAKTKWGMGFGKETLLELARRSEDAGIWTLQSTIFPENVSSIALHRACGFREVGYRDRIAKLGNRWLDSILFERRSKIVGV